MLTDCYSTLWNRKSFGLIDYKGTGCSDTGLIRTRYQNAGYHGTGWKRTGSKDICNKVQVQECLMGRLQVTKLYLLPQRVHIASKYLAIVEDEKILMKITY